MQSKKMKTFKIVMCVVMIFVSLLFLFPILWMIANSFKGDAQIAADMNGIAAFLPAAGEGGFFANYLAILTNSDLMRYIFNTPPDR